MSLGSLAATTRDVLGHDRDFSDVLPSDAHSSPLSRCSVDVDSFGNLVPRPAHQSQPAHHRDGICVEFGVVVRGALSCSKAMLLAVFGVLRRSPHKQMLRVDTSRGIAGMPDLKMVGDWAAIGYRPCDTVGKEGLPLMPEPAVWEAVDGSDSSSPDMAPIGAARVIHL